MVDVYDALLDQIAPLRGVEKPRRATTSPSARCLLGRAADRLPRGLPLTSHLTRHPFTALRSMEEQFLHWRSVGLSARGRLGQARGQATAPAPARRVPGRAPAGRLTAGP